MSVSVSANKNVLHHLNFEFEIGKKYAVVGSSGAGKSTLINTIMDGFSPVQQSVFVFRDTIRNNITLFKEFDEEKSEKSSRSGWFARIDRQNAD